MTSPEICSIIRKAILEEIPDAEVIMLPMADGGEGTVDAVVSACNGKIHKIKAAGPLGRAVEGELGIYNHGKSAVLEMSSVSGLALLRNDELNPLEANTYGTGELIRAALDLGVQEITIGIGGSATVDGGMGMAAALGCRFLDRNGMELPLKPQALKTLDRIDMSGLDPRLAQVRIRVACDVTNPLLGPNGSATVYGPQKGATPAMVGELEECLKKLAEVWLKQGILDSVEQPGDGAAGGLGAGLRAFCKATPTSGAKLVMGMLELEKYLPGTDLLITGEGCTDSQTDSGKLCGEIAAVCHASGIPVMLLSGALKGDLTGFSKTFDFAFSISSGAHATVAEAIKAGKDDLYFTARNLARLLKGA